MGKARQIFKPIFGLSDKIGLLVLFEAVQAWSKRENEDKKPIKYLKSLGLECE